MKVFKGRAFNPGDKSPVAIEERIEDVKFNIYKFNHRPKPPNSKQTLIITCFAEFGCESISLMYCIPRILQKYPGMYIICVGWFGREYLYRHLVDEYWEVKEEHQWLREYSRAFHHESKNLEKIEHGLKAYGQVWPSAAMGHFCLGNRCHECDHFWGSSKVDVCEKCNSPRVQKGLFADVQQHKRVAVSIPRPSRKVLQEADAYLKPNSVGVFARGRKCYGRNLTPEFYIKLIERLEKLGYNPIWLGEKQSVIPCPVPHIIDFSRLPESKNLELTLAIISKLEFTIQYWTASTRLAAMMGIPYLLFESPDQIFGQGQEGYRMELTSDYNKKKLVLSHYKNVLENPEESLNLTEQAIREMDADNWDNIMGLVDNGDLITTMMNNRDLWGRKCQRIS